MGIYVFETGGADSAAAEAHLVGTLDRRSLVAPINYSYSSAIVKSHDIRDRSAEGPKRVRVTRSHAQ